jgi:hypothetical protein
MLVQVLPKLPMREKDLTKAYYLGSLGFTEIADYGNYLILSKDEIEIHFFEHRELKPNENYGQVYIRVKGIDAFYQQLLNDHIAIHPNGRLEVKPWHQKEFALLDPDNNLLTFGESI